MARVHLTGAQAAALRNTTQISLINNSERILAQLNYAEAKVLEKIGMFVQNEAVENCPVDTGNLMLSITHETEGKWAVIGTPVEYSEAVELGTSRQKAQPYLRPAVEENIDVIKKIVKDGLENT